MWVEVRYAFLPMIYSIEPHNPLKRFKKGKLSTFPWCKQILCQAGLYDAYFDLPGEVGWEDLSSEAPKSFVAPRLLHCNCSFT